ncbi:MAG: polymer-forming cytoskeletal protein, partial [Rectinemataceae bacterium]|nr:polymer-forming cytoskeletal protein [Rectinemataceae bacterium]
MFGSRKPGFSHGNPTVFGREIIFDGNLSCRGLLEIRGKFSGSIDSLGDVVAARGSVLNLGNLTARVLALHGELKAENIRAASVRLHA